MDAAADSSSPDASSASRAAADILARSQALVDVYERLNAVRTAHGFSRGLFGGANHMLARLRTEMRCTEQGRNPNPNIASFEAHWNALRRCRGLTKMLCDVSRHAGVKVDCAVCPSVPGNCPKMEHQAKEDSVWLDAVVDDGEEWLRIISTGEKRLLQDMAAAGWDWDDEGDERDDGGKRFADSVEEAEEIDEGEVPLVRLVKQLVRTARAKPHICKIPRVHVLLTRIDEGKDPQIDRLLHDVRQLGGQDVAVVVDCANSEFLVASPPADQDALVNLLPRGSWSTASVSNLDTTILIGLVADVCHANIEVKPWFNKIVRAHIADELKSGSNLERHVYPFLRGKKLVTTRESAGRFWKLVNTMGSQSEIERARLLVPELPGENPPSLDADEKPNPSPPRPAHANLVAEWQGLSKHSTPPDLQLPVIVAEKPFNMDAEIASGHLPAAAREIAVEAKLTDLNAAVFLYGWANGYATVTANNEVKKKIIRALEREIVERREVMEHITDPHIAVVGSGRALACRGPPPSKGVLGSVTAT